MAKTPEQIEKEFERIDSLLDKLSSKMAKAFSVDPDKSMDEFQNALVSTISISDQLKKNQEEISLFGRTTNNLSSEQIKTLGRELNLNQKKLLQHKQLLKAQRSEVELQLKAAQRAGETRDVIDDLRTKLQQNETAQDQINQSIEKTLQTQKELNKQYRNAKLNEGVNKGLGKVKDTAKGVGDTLMQAFGISSLNPLSLLLDIFGFVVKAAIELDKEAGEAAKSMNQTYIEANNSRLAMVRLAEASGELLINSTHIQKTFLELNKTLGTSVAFEKLNLSLQKDIAFMAMMENYAGLTADESNSILRYSLQIGKSARQTSSLLMAQYKIESLKNKIVVNEKDVLKQVAQLSESIKFSIKGGAKELATALAAAKGLGINLEEVNNSASKLLNFEDSIEKELAAELLTGKQLNLEKARSAALNNDLATVAEEIKDQIGGAAEFQNMNRIQQEALADAVGLTRDNLLEAFGIQEQQKEISESAIETESAAYNALVARYGQQGALGVMMSQQLELQKQQVSLAEKMEAAKLKEKDAIAKELIPEMNKLWGKFDEILKKIKEIFDMFGGWKTILIAIAGILAVGIVANLLSTIKGMRDASRAAKSLLAIEKAVAGTEVVSNSYKMAGGLGPLGIAAVGGLIGAGLAALAMYTMSDGIISPSSGGSGFGDRVLFGPEGAISFNNKDTIVAGTNLFPKKVNDYASSEGSIQITNSSKEMSELKDAILALASRPVEVNVGGETIIKATTGALPNEAGLAAAKNSFQIQ